MGLSLVIFILFLSISGITLNHSVDLELDRRYVSWSWLLDAYGLEVPAPAASFADSGHRAALLGGRLFLDGRDIRRQESVLTGIADLGSLVVIGGETTVYLLTESGDFVEAIDLGSELSGPIEQIGRSGDRAILKSGGKLYRSDPDIALFEAWKDESAEHRCGTVRAAGFIQQLTKMKPNPGGSPKLESGLRVKRPEFVCASCGFAGAVEIIASNRQPSFDVRL